MRGRKKDGIRGGKKRRNIRREEEKQQKKVGQGQVREEGDEYGDEDGD